MRLFRIKIVSWEFFLEGQSECPLCVIEIGEVQQNPEKNSQLQLVISLYPAYSLKTGLHITERPRLMSALSHFDPPRRIFFEKYKKIGFLHLLQICVPGLADLHHGAEEEDSEASRGVHVSMMLPD